MDFPAPVSPLKIFSPFPRLISASLISVLYDRARKNDFEKYFGSKYCTFELDDWVFTEQTALQKLWDQLAIMSNFQLDIDFPYDVSDAVKIATKPEPLPYPYWASFAVW